MVFDKKEYQRRWHIKKHYDLDWKDYTQMITDQEGKCAICDKEMVPQARVHNAMCVDHDHETGQVRGLLCTTCNRGIGFFSDKIDHLEKAIQYLKDAMRKEVTADE